MPTSPDAHAVPRARIGWLLAALGAVLAILLAQAGSCHDSVTVCGDETICATVITGLGQAGAAMAETVDPTPEFADFGVLLAHVAADAAPVVPMPTDPAEVLGLCVALLLALLAAAVALTRSGALRAVVAGAEPVRVRASARTPVAVSLTMLCVLRT
ncbi:MULTISPECIES: hypothetical protein [Nocardia]|uniref:hypothetical protein n=1 Tax=Nocardia TaxID=1817 RepID=UPI0002E9BFB2|nr:MULTISPECIES: hypothetical protein [Nocardia]